MTWNFAVTDETECIAKPSQGHARSYILNYFQNNTEPFKAQLLCNNLLVKKKHQSAVWVAMNEQCWSAKQPC